MDILSEFRIISFGNKQMRDDPEEWKNTYGYIHAFIQHSAFLINGQMMQCLVSENQESLAVIQDRLNELESKVTAGGACESTEKLT